MQASISLKRILRSPSPTQIWIAVFLVWTLSLTGMVGVPGIFHSLRLKHLLSIKQDQVTQLQSELRLLQQEANELEKNKVTQQREIRRILGYAAPDELIFDFNSDGS